MTEPCEACPVRGMATIQPCLGTIHRPACNDIRNNLPGRADQLITLATGKEMVRSEADENQLRIAMDAELCEFGSGPCGCNGGPPRICKIDGPDRPREVMRIDCIKCKTGQRLSDLGSRASATARPSA